MGLVAGLCLLLYSVVGNDREKRKVKEAASVQEEFDCAVFPLPWNDLCLERPTPRLVADAVTRADDDMSELRDWYPNTGDLQRPLDVLLCQRSNFGWGASVHRQWAAALVAGLVSLLAGSLGAVLLSLPAIALVPLLAPLRELADMIAKNRDSAASKHAADKAVMSLWRGELDLPDSVTNTDLRSVQDRLAHIRQTNAHVPD